MEKKELIGRKVKGYSWDHINQKSYDIYGIIESYCEDNNSYKIKLNDGGFKYCDIDQIESCLLEEKDLVPENQTDMELLDKFALAALPALIREASVNATEEQIANAVYLMAKAMLDERGKYEND